MSEEISENIKIKSFLIEQITSEIDIIQTNNFKNVINGTGIILHTGLGRAPFSDQFWRENRDKICGYQNLEFDLVTGKRGDRLDYCSQLLHYLSGAEDALLVNNNAAALLLILNTLAMNKEVIVSRGELIEIGGSFRLPDVIGKSGAKLHEIGTTNRTHLRDYEKAINVNTGAILVAHTSNYKIEGFSTTPGLEEIIRYGKKYQIPVVLDQGSGDFNKNWKNNIQKLVKSEIDLLCFSGDKLLGGPQSGIVLGQHQLIRKCHYNPLYRALRCDKFTVMGLEWTLKQIALKQESKIPRNYLFNRKPENLSQVAKKIVSELAPEIVAFFGIVIKDTTVEMGSGSCPTEKFPSIGLKFTNPDAVAIATEFRRAEIPVVGYIRKNDFFIDLKAVTDDETVTLRQQIKNVYQRMNG